MPNLALLAGLALQMAQNPSPMTEETRSHDRLTQRAVAGRRVARALTIGRPGPRSPVILHFHGASWLPEQSAAGVFRDATILAIQAGAGSSVYAALVSTEANFQKLLEEADAGQRPVFLSAFSAGYGAVRAILRHSYSRVDGILLMDGLHAGLRENRVEAEGLDVFLRYAKDAAAGRKRMVITHSEIYPGTFASTTETTDWLLAGLSLRRKPVLRWGPGGMQQLSEVRRGRLAILGFAGNSAPDHVDHLHGMATWLRILRRL